MTSPMHLPHPRPDIGHRSIHGWQYIVDSACLTPCTALTACTATESISSADIQHLALCARMTGSAFGQAGAPA